MTLVLLLIPGADAWWTRLAGGAATHLSSHARHPRPATSDKTNGSQASPADSLKVSQLAARSGPSRPRRTSPTARSKTASLEGAALDAGRIQSVRCSYSRIAIARLAVGGARTPLLSFVQGGSESEAKPVAGERCFRTDRPLPTRHTAPRRGPRSACPAAPRIEVTTSDSCPRHQSVRAGSGVSSARHSWPESGA